MIKVARRIFRAVLVVIVAAAVVAVLGNTVLRDTPFGRFVRGAGGSAKTTAVNAALDASGVKEQIDQDLRSRSGEIASSTGLPEAQVTSVIDSLDIPSWSVTDLPAGAEARGSFETTYQGVAATVTTYRDPGYVTVSTGGQELTLAVPESAQAYVNYLSWL
ncbi:MAG: hypothetical protein SOY67_01440 [Collinsella sp.]|nr:hypothetical protein [Collinsella sp.]